MSRLDKLMKLLEAEPNDPFVLYGIAQEHAKEERFADAILFYDRCLAADPGYMYAHYHKAVAQQESGDTAAAEATLHAGIAAARRAGDMKAQSEMQLLLDSMG